MFQDSDADWIIVIVPGPQDYKRDVANWCQQSLEDYDDPSFSEVPLN